MLSRLVRRAVPVASRHLMRTRGAAFQGVHSFRRPMLSMGRRSLCTEEDPRNAPRDAMEYDVVIVGGGPAGLSAAIRLKQMCAENDTDLNICILEKGAASSIKMPHMLLPPMLHNEGNYVISLAQLCRWLGSQAEELGVEIFPGFPASEVLYNDDGNVVGVATADQGIAKDGSLKDSFVRGIEIRAKQTLFAEGCRGSCSEEVMERFNLRDGKDDQIYGLGLKEVWRVDPAQHKPGFIQHTVGWPTPHDVYAGSFLYHMKPDLVLVGMVIGLDYKNPYLNPYMEFQRLKHHPTVKRHLEGGECIQYGARCVNEGGFQSIPKLTFPGGALVGCSAGFLNVPKIKGTHTAMKSAMLAAESIFETMRDGSESVPEGTEVTGYQQALENSWVWDELRGVRNFHPSFKFGLLPGLAYSGLSAHLFRGKEPWTMHHAGRDVDATLPADQCKPIEYPKPDGKLSFDILSNVTRTGTNHEHDQPSHLRIREGMEDVPSNVSFAKYAAPESRFCPARVYEYPEGDQLVINAQNCIHCKACSIKTPKNYIKWTVPEAGGGGPAYELM